MTLDSTGTISINSEGLYINIFPNPVDNTLTISYNTEGEEVLVRISDITGRLVVDRIYQNNGNDIDIDLNDLSSGTYIYNIIVKEENIKGRLIKE